jgi:hypothetical protein
MFPLDINAFHTFDQWCERFSDPQGNTLFEISYMFDWWMNHALRHLGA